MSRGSGPKDGQIGPNSAPEFGQMCGPRFADVGHTFGQTRGPTHSTQQTHFNIALSSGRPHVVPLKAHVSKHSVSRGHFGAIFCHSGPPGGSLCRGGIHLNLRSHCSLVAQIPLINTIIELTSSFRQTSANIGRRSTNIDQLGGLGSNLDMFGQRLAKLGPCSMRGQKPTKRWPRLVSIGQARANDVADLPLGLPQLRPSSGQLSLTLGPTWARFCDQLRPIFANTVFSRSLPNLAARLAKLGCQLFEAPSGGRSGQRPRSGPNAGHKVCRKLGPNIGAARALNLSRPVLRAPRPLGACKIGCLD